MVNLNGVTTSKIHCKNLVITGKNSRGVWSSPWNFWYRQPLFFSALFPCIHTASCLLAARPKFSKSTYLLVLRCVASRVFYSFYSIHWVLSPEPHLFNRSHPKKFSRSMSIRSNVGNSAQYPNADKKPVTSTSRKIDCQHYFMIA